LDLGQVETAEVPNTISVDNYLSFLMVHYAAPNSQRLMSYDCRNSPGLLNQKFWIDSTFWHKSIFWRNFIMTSLENLNTKVISNELNFLLVALTVSSNAWFDSYWVLKTGQGAELVWTDWTYGWISQVSGHKKRESW
jgi:hypothetical protein